MDGTCLERRLWLKGLAVIGLSALLPVHAGERVLRLVREETGESAEVVYAREGIYEPTGYLRLCRLCRDVRRDRLHPMDPRLLDLLWAVQLSLDLAVGWGGRLVIQSGYRTEVTNREVGGAAGSYHLRGQAVDWHADGIDMPALSRWMSGWGGLGGMGFYPSGRDERGWLHLDTGPRRVWRADGVG